jgi:hypothetical protein
MVGRDRRLEKVGGWRREEGATRNEHGKHEKVVGRYL